jgi:hemolysin III
VERCASGAARARPITVLPMPSTHPVGRARAANRALLTATLVFAAAGSGVMIGWAFGATSLAAGASSLVYGATLLACALCSFLYNMLEASPQRRLLRLLDHAAIFLLIAGTYTPFAVLGMRRAFAGSLLTWVWGLSLAGIVLKLMLRERFDRLFVPLYLAIGFLFLGGLDEIAASMNAWSLALLFAGGIAYTVGALIYAKDIGNWTDPVWHAFVLAGKAAHFCAILVLLP